MNVFIIGVPRKDSSALLASPYMEKELKLLGISPSILPVNDEAQLTAAVQKVMLLGGLILTPLTGNGNIDKLLSDAMAKACGCGLELNQSVFQQLAEKNAKLSKEEVTRYATLPKGAEVYAVHDNTYPSYQLDGENIHAILLPADPAEQCAVFLNTVFPTFAQQPKYPCSSHILRVMDLSVEEVEAALKEGLNSENPCIAVYPGKDEAVIRVSVRAQDQQQASSACQSAAKTVLERLGSAVYGVDVPNIERALLQRLEKKGLHLALHESGSNHRAEKRLIKCKRADSVELNFPQVSGPAIDSAKQEHGPVSQQAAAAAAAALADSKTIGVAVTLPTAREKAASAFVAASFSGHVLTKEIPISGFHNVQQLADSCISHALNLARKFADSHPALPKGAVAALVPAGTIVHKAKGAAKEEATMASNEKKQSLPKRILSAIFPQKSDDKGEKLRKLGIILCLCVFCGSMGYLLNHRQQGINAQETQDKFTNLLEQVEQGTVNLKDFGLKEEDLEKVEAEVLDKYKPFVAMNEDTKGWITAGGTTAEEGKLSEVVVQAKDNDYYHRRGFDGEYSYYGVPYVDYECVIDADPDKCSDNTILYGHNIGNDGMMFNPMTRYKTLAHYKKYPTIRFDTIYRQQEYKIFGVMIVNAQPEQDNGTVFNYHQAVDFMNDDDFNNFVNEVRRRSMWDIDVDVQPTDKLLTVSTCCYDFRPEARCVVVARAVREGEDATVDTSTAKINADAYYPKAYYDALNEKAKYGHVKGIKIDGKKEYDLEVGKTLQLKAITDPADAPINTCTWDSSAAAVATVDKNGLVTAIAPGEANITAMADDGGYAATVKIKVKAKNALKSLYFEESELTLQQGQEYRLDVYADPEDAALELEWSCDSEAIGMTVNKSNQRQMYLKGLNVTQSPATITVKDKSTGISASIKVTVGQQKVVVTANPVTFAEGETEKYMTATVTPASAAKDIQVSSSDANIISVGTPEYNEKGNMRILLKKVGQTGSVNILFSMKGEQLTSAKATLPAAPVVQAATVSVNGTAVTSGATIPLTAGTTYKFNVTGTKYSDWTYDSNLISIDKDGNVTIKLTGNTTEQPVKISFTGPDGKKFEFTLTIPAAPAVQPQVKKCDICQAELKEGETHNHCSECKELDPNHKETCSKYVWPICDECKNPTNKHLDTCSKSPNYKPPVTTCNECGADLAGAHKETCSKYVWPTCEECNNPKNNHLDTCSQSPNYKPPVETCGECNQPVDKHLDTCTQSPNYVAPTPDPQPEETTPTCTCTPVEGAHTEGCPLYVIPTSEPAAQSLDEETPSEETPATPAE